jgi:hypothetical protein
MLSLELGAPRLAYGFAQAANTSVDLLRREFFKFVLVRWQLAAMRIVANAEEGGCP